MPRRREPEQLRIAGQSFMLVWLALNEDFHVPEASINSARPSTMTQSEGLTTSACYPGSKDAPLVSVILPVYNREACVARAISSVLAQTYEPIELIVVDDGSIDGTRDVVAGFGTAITLVTQQHGGVYAARNAGLRYAHGELVAFIDSDDFWYPEKLTLQVPLLDRPNVGLAFGDAIHVTAPYEGAPRTGLTSFAISPPQRGHAVDGLVRCNFVPTCTALARRKCIIEVGGFSEAAEVSADYLAWFRIALRHELDYVDDAVAEYTVHADGISFALDQSLSARIDLFSAELNQTTDARTRVLLQRLLFNLSMHLVFAAVRGRAQDASESLRLARKTAWRNADFKLASWSAAFMIDQIRSQARRLLA